VKAEKILVATDFSPASRLAFEAASRLARQTGAKLIVLHVEQGQPRLGPAYYDIPDPGIGEIARKLAALRPPFPDVAVEHRIEAGDPATEILRIAAEDSVDSLVAGSQNRSGMSRLVLGSVATSLLRKAPCAVLVCHPAQVGSGSLRPEKDQGGAAEEGNAE
jgi:nucleotide-binding universal stress UspA family protein